MQEKEDIEGRMADLEIEHEDLLKRFEALERRFDNPVTHAEFAKEFEKRDDRLAIWAEVLTVLISAPPRPAVFRRRFRSLPIAQDAYIEHGTSSLGQAFHEALVDVEQRIQHADELRRTVPDMPR